MSKRTRVTLRAAEQSFTMTVTKRQAQNVRILVHSVVVLFAHMVFLIMFTNFGPFFCLEMITCPRTSSRVVWASEHIRLHNFPPSWYSNPQLFFLSKILSKSSLNFDRRHPHFESCLALWSITCVLLKSQSFFSLSVGDWFKQSFLSVYYYRI